MARIIAAVSCFVAAFHAVAERPREEGMRLERETPEAKHDQRFMFQGGIGRTLEEYKADVERRKKLLTHRSTEGRNAQGGDSAMNASFAELGRLADFTCVTPEQRYPEMFPKGSTKHLGGGAFGDAYKVTISGCKNGNGGPLVMKSVGVDWQSDENEKFLKDQAWTEIFVGESLSKYPAVVYTFAHTNPCTQQEGTCFYMLMDYVNHGDLYSLLENNELTLHQRAFIFSVSLAGLQGLHKLGIVHRDIKPENIFIQKEAGSKYKYTPKIGDFGVSCCDAEHCQLVSVEKCELGYAGTFGYMSPRVIQGKKARADDDLWSMGKLLLQLVYNQAGTYFTTNELTAKPTVYHNRNQRAEFAKNFAKTQLLTKEDKQKLEKTDAAGGGTLVKLLDYLLCNACNSFFKTEKKNVQKAIELSNKWLLKLGMTPHDPKVEQRSENLQGCITDLIQSGQLQRGPEAKGQDVLSCGMTSQPEHDQLSDKAY